MTKAITIEVKYKGRTGINDAGFNLARLAFKDLTVKGRVAMREVIDSYALKIQRSARKNLRNLPTRWDEGTLARSIQTWITPMLRATITAIVYTDVPYSGFVHWGTGIYGENPEGGHRLTPWVYYDEKRKRFVWTRGMKPNKFLLEAFEEHQKDFIRAVRKVHRDFKKV